MSEVRRLTGFTATGHLHLGNYLGAMKPLIAGQAGTRTTAMIADLHALTLEHEPAELRRRSEEIARLLIAAGVTAPIYRQSELPSHSELHYLLEATTGYGEARRMIQFKEKSASQQQVRLALLTYPVLMAADILLHDTHEVPVGHDQAQHLELTRTIAGRFNERYGETFTMPMGVLPTFAARLMDLQNPTAKMSKSAVAGSGTIFLTDTAEETRYKIRKAVTTPEGVANLREILSAAGGDTTSTFDGYAHLKATVTEAVNETLAPVRARYAEIGPDVVAQVLRTGLSEASARAHATVSRAKRAIGL